MIAVWIFAQMHFMLLGLELARPASSSERCHFTTTITTTTARGVVAQHTAATADATSALTREHAGSLKSHTKPLSLFRLHVFLSVCTMSSPHAHSC